MEALSGYATTLRGEQLIFSMFGNNHGACNRDATAVLDAICVAMVEELGAASADTDQALANQPESTTSARLQDSVATILPVQYLFTMPMSTKQDHHCLRQFASARGRAGL